jgi:hypothetical protein
MTDDAARYVRSGDGQVACRVSDLALGRVGAGDYCGCAATIVTVHEFSSRRSNSLVPFGPCPGARVSRVIRRGYG